MTLEQLAEKMRESGATDEEIADEVENLSLLARMRALHPEMLPCFDDVTSARLFADVFSDKLRFCSTANCYYYFDGARWRLDEASIRAARCAKVFSVLLVKLGNEQTSIESQKKFFSAANKYTSLHNRETLLRDARDVHAFSRANLDENDALFNVENGTINLATGEFYQHRASDLLAKVASVIYDPAARSADFEKFIDEIMQGDVEKTKYLQKVCGLSLTADTSNEQCWLLYGASTRNGKSTLVETVSHVLGDYSTAALPETLAQRKNKDTRNASGDIARLDGARLLVMSEPPRRMLFDVALLKTLLGRDKITARQLYEREFSFVPKFKLLINTNSLPLVNDNTLFSSGRVVVVPFTKHFEPAEQDKTLKTRLQTSANASGILNWLLDGLRLYRAEGLKQPPSIVQATDEYRKISDKIGLFISECLHPCKQNCAASAVYNVYANWCDENGFGTENKRNFFDELSARKLLVPSATVNGRTVRNAIRGYAILSNQPRLAGVDTDAEIEAVESGLEEFSA